MMLSSNSGCRSVRLDMIGRQPVMSKHCSSSAGQRNIYVHAAAYSLDCHGGAMIYRDLYKTFQSLVERRTESVTTMNHELSVSNKSLRIVVMI